VAPQYHTPPLKVHKLTWVEMVEFQLNSLFYNCDEKYSLGINVRNKNDLWPSLRKFLIMNLKVGLRRTSPLHSMEFIFPKTR
jgi:hypothetical protein